MQKCLILVLDYTKNQRTFQKRTAQIALHGSCGFGNALYLSSRKYATPRLCGG